MAKRGAKLKWIDWDKVDKMCAIHCTGEEIAAILDVDYDTLQRSCKREKKKKFADYIRQKSSNGKMSLRRRQYSAAMEGNATMLVWLGKNWLGQTDKIEEEDDQQTNNINIILTRE
jgi:IS30 family transposase